MHRAGVEAVVSPALPIGTDTAHVGAPHDCSFPPEIVDKIDGMELHGMGARLPGFKKQELFLVCSWVQERQLISGQVLRTISI